MPLDGDTSTMGELNEVLRQLVHATWRSYAPRRMVKLGDPSSDSGLAIPTTASLTAAIPKHLVVPAGAVIPLLVYRSYMALDRAWRVPRCSVDTESRDHLYITVQFAQAGPILVVKNNYAVDIQLRGALYFPEVTVEGLAVPMSRD